MNNLYNENIYVSVPEEKQVIKTANNSPVKEVVVLKSSDPRFTEGMKLLATLTSATKYKEGYFINTRHVLSDI